jgi:hypothetical protein
VIGATWLQQDPFGFRPQGQHDRIAIPVVAFARDVVALGRVGEPLARDPLSVTVAVLDDQTGGAPRPGVLQLERADQAGGAEQLSVRVEVGESLDDALSLCGDHGNQVAMDSARASSAAISSTQSGRRNRNGSTSVRTSQVPVHSPSVADGSAPPAST